MVRKRSGGTLRTAFSSMDLAERVRYVHAHGPHTADSPEGAFMLLAPMYLEHPGLLPADLAHAVARRRRPGPKSIMFRTARTEFNKSWSLVVLGGRSQSHQCVTRAQRIVILRLRAFIQRCRNRV